MNKYTDPVFRRKQRLERSSTTGRRGRGLDFLLIQDLVTSLGCALAGTASTVNEALEFIETVPSDGAFIDVNLGGELAVPVRQALFRRGIPRIVVTGYNNAPPMLDGFPV